MNTPNTLNWNLVGWLGGQLGGSLWMLVAGVLAFRLDTAAGAKVVALFVMANLIGVGLWRRRTRLSPQAGLQILMLVLGIIGLSAVFILDNAGIYEAIQVGGAISAEATYAIIALVVVALQAMFFFRFGRRTSNADYERDS
jgi:hypothetical protein